MRKLIYHGIFISVLSVLLTFGLVHAQEAAATFPLGPMPKLIVFVIAVVISVITDTIMCLTLAAGPHPIRVILHSIPWAFINVYWWDYIAPATGTTLFTLRFAQVGDPAWNYWVGINVIVAFILNFIFSQVVFRFLRGAAPSPNWQDALLSGLDAVVPAILFIVLPLLGIF